jgi:hypothetical protein
MLRQERTHAELEGDVEQCERGELGRLREQPRIDENRLSSRQRGCHGAIATGAAR